MAGCSEVYWLEMRRTIEEEKRPVSHKRAERAIRLAGVEHVGVTLKDVSNRVRVTGEDKRRNARHSKSKPIAIAACAIVKENKRPTNEIDRRKEAWPGGQLRRA